MSRFTYMVLGGEIGDLQMQPLTADMAWTDIQAKFLHPEAIEVVGMFPDQKTARDAWKARTWATVDNALMRFFIIPLDNYDLPPVTARKLHYDLANPILHLAQNIRAGIS